MHYWLGYTINRWWFGDPNNLFYCVMFKNLMAAVFCLISNSVVSHISLTNWTATKRLHSVILQTPTIILIWRKVLRKSGRFVGKYWFIKGEMLTIKQYLINTVGINKVQHIAVLKLLLSLKPSTSMFWMYCYQYSLHVLKSLLGFKSSTFIFCVSCYYWSLAHSCS
jgi:hypothetical protein